MYTTCMHILTFLRTCILTHMSGYYAVAGESKAKFTQRMLDLKLWLKNRPESIIILTCHWAVAKALTGVDFMNCEMRSYLYDDLLKEPHVHK